MNKNELRRLKEEPLVKLFSEMPEGLYEEYKKNNPAMKWAVDISRQIMAK